MKYLRFISIYIDVSIGNGNDKILNGSNRTLFKSHTRHLTCERSKP
jgi:hypothetical protein